MLRQPEEPHHGKAAGALKKIRSVMVKDLRGCHLDPERVRYWARIFGVTEAELRKALRTTVLPASDSHKKAIPARSNKLLLVRPDIAPEAGESAPADTSRRKQTKRA
jgi:hypothetical protein